MAWVIGVLIIVGLLFLVLEILVFPGHGVPGIIGLILLAVAVWQAYSQYGAITGHFVLGGTLVLSVAGLVVALRSGTWNRMMLKEGIDSKVNVIKEGEVKAGDAGKTVSRLNPAGKAIINDEYYEVHTQGEFLDPGTHIIVTKTSYNKIYVKRKS